VPTERYVTAVLREWDAWQSSEISTGQAIQTVYFGGGTPSHIDPAGIATLLDVIVSRRPIAAAAEVTLEANPDDVTVARAAAWRAAGVNRISLGVQSFDPAALRWMHRAHDDGQIAPAVEAVRAAGFDELSLDLIFGLPAALGRDWDSDLARAFALEPEHLSLYGLTVEAHTPLGRWADRGDVIPADEERYAAEFLAADRALAEWGYEHYEVSNAARPGHRARHNSAYWRRAPFIGLGPSAHSGFGRRRQWNLREWSAYERALMEGRTAVESVEDLTSAAVELEEVYLGLRTAEGLPVGRLPNESVTAWAEAGWAITEEGRVRLTPEGWLRLDALAAATPLRRPA
jgi:oxygen-independent coproporphyrinogen-3 oxidase